MTAKSLRFVILCETTEFPAWQADCIKEVVLSGLAVPVGLVLKKGDTREPTGRWRRRWANRSLVLWRLFCRVYVNVFSKATRSVDMATFLAGIPQAHDSPTRVGKHGEKLSQSTIVFIRGLEPHFILRLGFGILKGEVLDCAPYGVWSYHHGDPTAFRGQPPGFWEMYSSTPITGSMLQVLGRELDAGTVLHQGFFKTNLHSYVKTRDAIYFGSSSWVRRTCAAIIENGWRSEASSQRLSSGPVWREPSNTAMIVFLWRASRNFCRAQVAYRLFRQKWNCGVIEAPIHVVAGLEGMEKQAAALGRVHWMRECPGNFFADPFGYEIDRDRIRVLFELYEWRRGLGLIASTEFDGTTFGGIEVVLEAPTHLSYPFIVNDGDEIYFVPEHSAARNVSAFLLSAAGLPHQKKTMFGRIELIDPTILKCGDKYWLFALDESRSENSDLHLFFSESLQGDWRAHPLNPVKTDVRSARPAGTPFVHEGRLFRPAQDCSTHYGRATVVNQVTVLTETEYEENPVSEVRPSSGTKYDYGLHTVAAVGNRTLIDGARKELRFPAMGI